MNKPEISVILPSMNEGDNVTKVLDELIDELGKIGKPYEIIAIDSPSENSSYETFKSYAQKYSQITAIQLSDRRAAGNGKSVQYMIGFELAQGDVIVQLDSDGQDNPADLIKFLQKLDEGYDLVVGHKQKRKDGQMYMFWSKIGNTFTRKLTGTDVHDMNCGFKAYRSHVAKRLNLKGRWYRFIPSLLANKGYRISEVPIENRKREWGKSNFNFKNRLEGGLFDLFVIYLLNRIGETPMYFWGWLSLYVSALGFVVTLIPLLIAIEPFYKIALFLLGLFTLFWGIAFYFIGFVTEYNRSKEILPISSYGIRELYKKST